MCGLNKLEDLFHSAGTVLLEALAHLRKQYKSHETIEILFVSGYECYQSNIKCLFACLISCYGCLDIHIMYKSRVTCSR